MYEELLRCLREHAKPWNCADNCICRDAVKRGYGSCSDELAKLAADAIEERDKYALTIQHEMMAEAESHIALVERLNKRIEELSKRVPPVPHGRLIDADALLDDLLFPSKQFEQGMRELVGDAPTVIPAEEEV